MPLVGGKAKVTVKNNYLVIKRLYDAFRFAGTEQVLVGIPQEKSVSYPSGVTNVQLMYIHTYGSPVNGIPPRPTIEPAIEEHRAELAAMMKRSLNLAFIGNLLGAKSVRNRAGMMAVNYIRARFGSGALAPNAPSTIRMKGSSAPLIDTGQLRNSITYVIRKK